MRVKVEVFGTLRDRLGWRERTVIIEGDSVSLDRVLNELPDLRKYLVSDDSLREGFIVFINGIHAQFKGGLRAELRDGDEIAVFPPGAGG